MTSLPALATSWDAPLFNRSLIEGILAAATMRGIGVADTLFLSKGYDGPQQIFFNNRDTVTLQSIRGVSSENAFQKRLKFVLPVLKP